MGFQYEPINVEPINDDDIELVVGERRQRRRSLARRLIRIALTVALALALVNAYIVPLGPRRQSIPSYDKQAAAMLNDLEEHLEEWPIGEPVRCYTKDDMEPLPDYEDPHHEELKWVSVPNIELDSDSLYFFARSARSEHGHRVTAGEIAFEASDNVDQVTVSAKVGYHHKLYAEVCTFTRDSGDLGVGVIVPPHNHEHDGHHHPHHRHHHIPNIVKLVVTFPAGKNEPLAVKKLETSLPLYKHLIGDIGKKVSFGSISLQGANSPIKSESLTAESAIVRTVNAAITGSFNGTNSMIIRTANAPIEVDVTFTSTLKPDEEPAHLELVTANAKLHAAISLVASGDAGSGNFAVSTRSANAPIVVVFESAPAGSVLNYEAKTANAGVDITLHESYEGTFKAATVWGKASFNERKEPTDPSGDERVRTVSLKQVKNIAFEGEVFWGEKSDDTPAGEVKVSTAMGPVSVTL